MLDLLKVYLAKPLRRGAAETTRLSQVQKTILRSGSGAAGATTSLSRPIKQLSGSRITRKSL